METRHLSHRSLRDLTGRWMFYGKDGPLDLRYQYDGLAFNDAHDSMCKVEAADGHFLGDFVWNVHAMQEA